MAAPSLIAFGAISPWPNSEQLDQLRHALQQQDSLKPIVKVAQELPQLWKALSKQQPSLHSIAGEAAADELALWITGARETLENRGNVTKMPLTTIIHISQYVSSLRQRDDQIEHESVIKSVTAGGGIQGLCVGLLSALAVASAETEEDVGKFAALSLQLAFCMGANIDLDCYDQYGKSKTSTIAVRWKAPTKLEDIQSLISRFPDTYIAVVRDVRDVTITTPGHALEKVRHDLSQAGAFVRDIGVSGRYHIAKNEEIPDQILQICRARFHATLDGHALVRSNTNSQVFPDNDDMLAALRCILVERADWYSTMSAASSTLKDRSDNPFILSIGTDAVPQSIAKNFAVVKSTVLSTDRSSATEGTETPTSVQEPIASEPEYPSDAIAVLGMGCRFPGADSIDEFWDLLTEGKSMLSEMPQARFARDHSSRSKEGYRYWGSFLENIEAFDQGFFKKSSREASSMDPQQRILLEVAYEALESSGYFSPGSTRNSDVGCYIGACATDYDFNVASHPPNAYSAIGTLRSFLSGKLSHYFGWSGPSIVMDTACSSSAVAIHTACNALRTNQCSMALAGGITLMTSPYLYENFSAAQFLSKTGGSKPFSSDADGYGRGEGGGLVVLKRLSHALRDNDHIISVIAGSAVNQNDNCVPITVPHTSSQGNLYQQVAEQAGTVPKEVTFVEAHGTGTPVGDPIEMESIRRIFGGPDRAIPLVVSSAKGNIGHLEGASGVVALIKAILQMQNRVAPRQASFKTLNSKIPPLEPDKMIIPVSNMDLSGERITACINNYGAAGSNAAMMLLEAPGIQRSMLETHISPLRHGKYPIQLAAASAASLSLYCAALDKYCRRTLLNSSSSQKTQFFSDLAFSLASRLNQDLPYMFTSTATDVDQLQTQLGQQTATTTSIKQRSTKAPAIVLCFGGQVSNKVGLDERLWHESSLLRSHLDKCDGTLRKMGYPGLYPDIFSNEAVTNVIVLHSIIFATQYACAQAWLESGLRVDALVGHSFGQLTALCVSGTLSLSDGLRLVAGRASLMQRYWGLESGTMIAIEADQQTIEELQNAICTSNSGYKLEIACLNGPTSHVVVGDRASVGELEKALIERGLRHKTLDVPYGFHSRFTEPLLPHLENLASSLVFNEPNIPLETCSDASSWVTPTAQLITSHTREPVFFGQAVQRLHDRFGPCTWVEAGSDSSIVSMVRRALGQSQTAGNNFMPMQLNKTHSIDSVADTTTAIWNAGHRVQFWNFHKSQRRQYNRLRLPPYSWENSKHWLALEMSTALNEKSVPAPAPTTTQAPPPPVLLRQDSVDERGSQFVIGTNSEEFQTIVEGFESWEKAVCPSTLFVEIALRAVKEASRERHDGLLSVKQIHVHSPITGTTENSVVKLDLENLAQGWRFRVKSTDGAANGSHIEICHAEGTIISKAVDDNIEEFSRFERLTGSRGNFASIAEDPRSESLRGNVLYKMLARITRYPNWYRGVRSMAAAESRIAAKVKIPAGVPELISKKSATPLPLLESFFQVASLHANCLQDNLDDDTVFRLGSIESLKWAPAFELATAEASWDVVAYISSNTGGPAYDMFIYDADTAQLRMLLLGVQFTNVHTQSTSLNKQVTHVAPVEKAESSLRQEPQAAPQMQPVQPSVTSPVKKDVKKSIYEDICGILESLADIPRDQISGEATFDGLDIDSLMVIEIISELSTFFKVDLPIDEMVELTDITSLVNYLHGKGVKGASPTDDSDSSSESSGSAFSTAASSPMDSAASGTETPPELVDEPVKSVSQPILEPTSNVGSSPLNMGRNGIHEVFEGLRNNFGKHAERTGAKGFWTQVYPQQADLVCKYVVDAFRDLGCDLEKLKAGQRLPPIDVLPRHKHLLAQLHRILEDSGLLEVQSDQIQIRTAKPLDRTPLATQQDRMLQNHPDYAAETRLLNVTGPRLAECMKGKKEPLTLLFGDKRNLALLADFYANSPMPKAATGLLADFVSAIYKAKQSNGTLYILEVGAGTGGTTKHLVDVLTKSGVSFEYTFTDISQALVAQAKKNFSNVSQMRYTTLDCGKPASQELLGKFHLVVSTNCIHATSNITVSTQNLLPTIREDGALCLLEFTRNLYWFDLVFGLLEGWWLFSDGRQHALADQWSWGNKLHAAGFKHVSWTEGDTEEENTVRLVCAFRSEPKEERKSSPPTGVITKRAGIPMQEIVWKRVGALELAVDVYFPKTPDPPGKKRPIALLIHGGGHFLFGRKDVPPKHIRTLIERGFLPISTDYRLCPETNLFDGPMADCRDALRWATERLPSVPLAGPAVKPDPTKVVSLGWSSGGQLAMSLGYTAPSLGIKAPDAIIALYPPSDMESQHWHEPCYPLAAEEEPTEIKDVLSGVRDSPIVEYAPISEKRTMELSLTLKDDRAKIILHMCWNSQTIPILIHGLPHPESVSADDKTDWRYRPAASAEQVQAISPLWQIKQGKYKTPTFIAHGRADDWLPLSMSERTIEELESRGVPCKLAIPEQCRHAFDLFPVGDPLGMGWAAIEQGYEFICDQLGMSR